jgi:predicted aldo/keto reductase-like oxidoreductase
LKDSLKRLQTDYIDLLFIKNQDSEEVMKQALGRNGSLRVAREAQKAGIVRHIGLTSHSEKFAYKSLRTGEYEAIMFPYNLLNTAAEKRILPLCGKKNFGFVCMKPVAGGLLTVPSKVFAKMTKAKAHTTAAAATRFCLGRPEVDTVIPGLATIKHLREALSAVGLAMTAAERERAVKKVVRLGSWFCRNCGYCKPCPEEIEINGVFALYHFRKNYDLKEYARRQYKRLKVKATACANCGACLPRCPYNIKIPKRLRAAHRALAG